MESDSRTWSAASGPSFSARVITRSTALSYTSYVVFASNTSRRAIAPNAASAKCSSGSGRRSRGRRRRSACSQTASRIRRAPSSQRCAAAEIARTWVAVSPPGTVRRRCASASRQTASSPRSRERADRARAGSSADGRRRTHPEKSVTGVVGVGSARSCPPPPASAGGSPPGRVSSRWVGRSVTRVLGRASRSASSPGAGAVSGGTSSSGRVSASRKRRCMRAPDVMPLGRPVTASIGWVAVDFAVRIGVGQCERCATRDGASRRADAAGDPRTADPSGDTRRHARAPRQNIRAIQ